MSQNVHRFIGLQRVDPSKKPLKIHKVELVEIYEPFSEDQAKTQAGRCLSCGNPYCEWKYPVYNYIPNWLKFTNEGRIFEVAELSHQTNTPPEVCGCACPQDRLCEGSYTLNDELDAVIIGSIERYISDEVFEMGWRPDIFSVKQAGKKVAIIGADPAGLAYADILTRNGVQTITFDCHPEIGGLLTFSAPASKLEKEVMTRRREIFTGMGIESKLNTGVGRGVQLGDLLSDYGAVLLGVGTYQSMHSGLENEDANGVYTALPFLIANIEQLMGSGKTRDGPFVSMEDRRVAVLGGGDIVMDYVHTSVRQGTEHTTCVYCRDEENMSGSRREVKNAREEGVEFKFNVQPLRTEMNGNGKISGVKMVRTGMGEPDARGCCHAEIIASSEYIVPTDVVIIVFGLRPHNMEWLAKHSVKLDSQGRITAPEGSSSAFQTSNPKIFTDGDIIRGSDLTVTAIAEGRKAADGTMNWLEV